MEIRMDLCHAVPGRFRLKIPELRQSARLRKALKKGLEYNQGVLSVETRPVTGSVIICYEADRIAAADLIHELRSCLKDLSGRNLSLEEKIPDSPPVDGRDTRTSGLMTYYLVNGIVLTSFMAYALIRRIFFRSPLPQGLLSLTGFVAMLGAIPLLRRTFRDLRRKRRVTLFPFLTAAAFGAVMAGEALVALEVLWVLAIGMLLEEYVSERTKRSIRELLEVAPEKAILLRGEAEIDTTTTDIRINDMVVVRTGMKIPVDGTVMKGEALVDTSHLTGRSQPELCEAKSSVFAGTRICQGTLFLRVDKLGEDTFLARIRHFVEHSLSQPTEIEKRADILAARLTKLGLLATCLTFLLTRNLSRSFSVMLVMACPCATVLAASTAVAAAIANAARRQVLIKGGIYLEQVPSIDIICFDKTGTLTTEAPHVTVVTPRAPRQDPDRILQMGAGAETSATHPMAKALVQEAHRRRLELQLPDHSEVFLGRGVQAVYNEDIILVGNREFLSSKGIRVNYFQRKADALMAAGQTVLYVARNSRLQGIIAVDNTPRPGLPSVLHQLRRRGVAELYIISGDSEPIVHAMARDYGFDHYRGNLLPHEKAALVEKLEAEGNRVMMVGDGVNDALVLSRASVGVALGAGASEVAIAAADIALLKSDLGDLVFLHCLSEKTLRIVEQNFWIATLTNLLGIILAAGGWMPPLITGTLHVGHSLGILVNSGRILRWKPASGSLIGFPISK